MICEHLVTLQTCALGSPIHHPVAFCSGQRHCQTLEAFRGRRPNPWPERRVEQRFWHRTFSLRISLRHTIGSLVGDNYFYSVKTGALGAKRSAIVRSGCCPGGDSRGPERSAVLTAALTGPGFDGGARRRAQL
eukprot:2114108-Prymnesium_polylepis.2